MAMTSEYVKSLADTIAASAPNRNTTHGNAANGEKDTAVPGGIEEARNALLAACSMLLNAATDPIERLKNMALVDKHNLISLQIINHYHIATIVPYTGHISLAELSSKCKLSTEILTRILRQAMTYQVFVEDEVGYIAHTQTSRELPRLAPLLYYQLEICLPSTMSLLEWLKQDGGKGHRSPFQIAHATDDTWWTYAENRPSLTENYGRYMALITNGGPHDVSHVVEGFRWGELGHASIVDIGGADAFVAITLAEAFPHLSIRVQDSANLQRSAEAKIPAELHSRVTFEPHSFFEPQPLSSHETDVFLLRHILHDWEDLDCVQILRQVVASMKPGARIIVAEQVLAQPGTVDPQTEKIMRALDMQMLVQFGSKERTLEDWGALFTCADERLQIVGLTKPEESADTLMELQLCR